MKKTFTANEVMILLEDIKSDFRVVKELVLDHGEQLKALRERVDALFEQVAENTMAINMLQQDVAEIKKELIIMNRKLDNKVDIKEHRQLSKRVSILETKLA